MLSGGKPAAAMVSRKGVFRLFQVGTLRPCLSLPSPVSTTIRREGVSTTSEWIDIFSRPSSVAKRGMSHGNFRISSLVAKGRMNRVLPVVSSSTILVILTLPTFQRMRRSLATRPALHRSVAAGLGCQLKRTGECAAVEQDVLSGDETRLGAAQKRASKAEFFGLAKTPGGIEFGALCQHFVHGDAAFLSFRLGDRAAQPVGVERTRQQAVDGDVVDHSLARNARDKSGEAEIGR